MRWLHENTHRQNRATGHGTAGNKCLVTELCRLLKRYVRCVVTRGTASADRRRDREPVRPAGRAGRDRLDGQDDEDPSLTG